MERRLSAILAVDVVGYSRLMERDEADTFERLRAHRKELFEPEISAHHGRIFKLMGDGLLAEFGSVVDAVECAVLLQRQMVERNSDQPDEWRIDVRMGVHVGDVIVEGDDRHGDAVNIAARLQQIAKPGGICVSGTVVDHVRHKVALRFEPRGEERLKNIDELVAVYTLALDLAPVPSARRRRRAWQWGAVAGLLLAGAAAFYGIAALNPPPGPASSDDGIPTIVVLPFEDLTGGQGGGEMDLTKVGKGIAEELITDLSTFPDFKVLSSTTSFAFAGKPIPEIVEATHATFVVEGSIRQSGEIGLATMQLIGAKTDEHLKSIQVTEKVTDPAELQRRIAGKIRDELGGMSGTFRNELYRIAEIKADSDRSEYDYYVMGHIFFHRRKRIDEDVSEMDHAAEIWRHGLERNAGSTLLRCKLSQAESWFRRTEVARDFIEQAKAQKKKSRLDEWCIHYAQAILSLRMGERRFAAGEARRVLDMAPYDTMAAADMAWIFRNTGAYDEAIAAMTFAVTHDRAPPKWYFWDLLRMYQTAGRPRELVALAETEALRNVRYAKWWYDVMGAALQKAGLPEKAAEAWKKAASLPDPPEP
jgi:class 3 adenylate cyclase/TolB-like protein